ncbi:S-(hydroxymethyl)glutathione dehydrogenase/alcohol dehydrogenase [Rhodovulum iodosum]|uniref:S-(Hydroxymethyl)glutathione dehydrogenase/alcohol dehydrogenase n=1 Tax=Rhodovulum iodosum TaxID=68291 RepID=A0ABV3XX06_9RHOB|nr:Zn-dependent alcohol dehydrogenase [Rhodovulum robiginosum]RSK34096.1 Zn-dependent alcohol dehydrogenase [Rhodovulum robiginosum]
MQTIRAAVCHAFNAPLNVEEVRLRAPGPGEVEVELAACAVCHSDISLAEGAWGGMLPAVYGHEAAGHVASVGPGVQGVAPGDAVLVTLIRACGHCVSCASGKPVLCITRTDEEAGPLSAADGSPILQGLDCGAFAERVVVDVSQCAVLPDDMALDAACLISCGVITGLGAAVNTARIRPGEVAVVIGAGGVGLNAIQGARLAGAARVIAVDISEEKLAVARAFGATDGVLATDPKPWRAAARAAGRAADAVLVTVGAAPAYQTAPRYLAPGGRMVAVGMPHSGQTAAYEPFILARTGQTMTGSMMGDTVLTRDIPWIVDLYRQGRLKLDELVSGRWSLDQINEAIADTKSGAARRNVIVFR